MKRETVIVLDFGGQYNQLIARRVRECNVYCEIYSYKTDLEKIKAMEPKGIIFTGGPNSVYLEDSPSYAKEIYDLGIPVLGICYGSQLMMHQLGGKVCKAPVREYGKIEVTVDQSSALFENVSEKTICWMSHNDYIEQAAPGFKIIAHTPDCPVAAVENVEKKLYATQFHPEVLHTKEGKQMLANFVFNVCGCAGSWKMDSFVEESIKAIREKVGDGKVLCALSGGVDSSVAAVLLSKAVGDQLTCVFVDHGLLRKNEGDEVEAVFGPDGNYNLNFIRVNAQERALMGGMRGVGFAALLGLDDFRKDAFATGMHAYLIQKKYPHAEIAFSCPRLRPIINNDKINPKDVHETQLTQIICAYRLFMPFASITISTRERAGYRNGIINIAATKISAGVSTGIGDHIEDEDSKGDPQFIISDDRDVHAVRQAIIDEGLQPVFSDYIYAG